MNDLSLSNPVHYEMSGSELVRLDELEEIIERGLKTFVEVGTSLLYIRDNRLYRANHDTFEKYCRERWGFVASRARQLIAAAEVANNLKSVTSGNTLEDRDDTPDGGNGFIPERHLRPLVGLDPDVQREAWQKAIDTAPNGKVTAAHVESTVQEYTEIRRPHVANNSGNNEWYTPTEYIAAARVVMGCIDLDPASSARANEVVGASTYYTIDDDGLSHRWFGNVWLNPPYAKGIIDRFTEKLTMHFVAGDISEAICLVNNATETTWFLELVEYAVAVVFPANRVRFWRPDGDRGAPLQGQAILYFGKYPERFIAAFQEFGWAAHISKPG